MNNHQHTLNDDHDSMIELSPDEQKHAAHLRLLASICEVPATILAIRMRAKLPVVAALATEKQAA
ncbi:MAG: hypothetical protein HKN23_17920 [Verrucomicrobiales bacterium]|nr:hypothetical protein [Verrucomicrobiales bacterium]